MFVSETTAELAGAAHRLLGKPSKRILQVIIEVNCYTLSIFRCTPLVCFRQDERPSVGANFSPAESLQAQDAGA